MYFRVKRTGDYAYLQIVESFRENGQVHQRVLSTVGRLDALQATGRMDALMRSGLRFCEKLAVIDAHAAGQTQPVQEQRLEERGESWEWAEILRGLDNVQEVEAVFEGKRFGLRSQVLGQAHKAFMASGVALRPRLREKA